MFNLFLNRISRQSFFKATFKVNCRLLVFNKQLLRCLFSTGVLQSTYIWPLVDFAWKVLNDTCGGEQ